MDDQVRAVNIKLGALIELQDAVKAGDDRTLAELKMTNTMSCSPCHRVSFFFLGGQRHCKILFKNTEHSVDKERRSHDK